MKTSEKGRELIQHFESLHDGDLSKIGLQPKMCPAGIWTVGYGHALTDISGKFFKGVEGYRRMIEMYPELETITETEANDLLQEDLVKWERYVSSKLKRGVTQSQFDALVSHSYNTGGSNTLFKLINNYEDYEAIENWFISKYITANGKFLKGLQRRRNSEWVLYSTGKLDFNAKV